MFFETESHVTQALTSGLPSARAVGMCHHAEFGQCCGLNLWLCAS